MTRPLFIKFFLIPLVMTYFTLLERSAVAIEEVPYILIEQNGEFSLREYPPHIVAETTVDGTFDQVGSEGFRRLVAYINGENRKKQSIAMTAPVNQERMGDSWRITFVMPAKYALDTLPAPIDSRVSIRQEPKRLIAVVRYSGTWSRKRYIKHEKQLLEWIKNRSFKQTSEPVWARYNSPFMPWFLRRNEVLIPVDPL